MRIRDCTLWMVVHPLLPQFSSHHHLLPLFGRNHHFYFYLFPLWSTSLMAFLSWSYPISHVKKLFPILYSFVSNFHCETYELAKHCWSSNTLSTRVILPHLPLFILMSGTFLGHLFVWLPLFYDLCRWFPHGYLDLLVEIQERGFFSIPIISKNCQN